VLFGGHGAVLAGKRPQEGGHASCSSAIVGCTLSWTYSAVHMQRADLIV